MHTAREQAAKRARITSATAPDAASVSLPAPIGGSGASGGAYPGFVLAADAAELPETSEAPLWARLHERGNDRYGDGDGSGDSEGERAAEDAAYLAGLAARAAEAERAADEAVAGFRTARAAIVGVRAAAAGAFAAEKAMHALSGGATGDGTTTSMSKKQPVLRVVRRKRAAPTPEPAPTRTHMAATTTTLTPTPLPPTPTPTSPEIKQQLVSGYDSVGSSSSSDG